MYELTIRNIKTNEEMIIFGYTTFDAFRRANLELTDWVVTDLEYVD